MTVIAMECPVTMGYNDTSNEKVKILKEIPPINFEDVVIGQYTSGNGKPGYTVF
jgi:glucose-6-phosphate 1-dehydrogenase